MTPSHWLYKEKVAVLYDGNCRLCRRTMEFFRVFDWFGSIDYLNAFDAKQIAAYGLGWLDAKGLMADMHVVRGKKIWKGFAAYRVLAGRIPLFWPLWPFLYIWPVPAIGGRIYRRIADTRSCEVPKQ